MSNTIWCVYHDEALVNEYNLQETENFKLYYTKEKRYSDATSLNYAQLYLNEFVALYYVWQNQIKSDIITFCHYNRIISNDMIDIDYVLEHGFQTYHKIEFDTPNKLFDKVGLTYSFSIFLSFIKDKLDCFSLVDYLYFLNNGDLKYIPGREIFSSTWEEFNRMMNFIDHFLKYFLAYHGLEREYNLHEIPLYKYKSISELLNDLNYGLWVKYFKSEHNQFFSGFPRTIGFMIEILIGMWFKFFSKRLA